MTRARRPYGGVSADARRAMRRELLVEGVFDVVGRQGVAGTTVDAVCAAAGLTKRYFYESFTNLDAALVAAMDTAFDGLRARLTAATETMATAAVATPAGRAQTVVEILVDTLAADPRLTRLYVESPGHDALRARREASIVDFTELLLTEAIGFRRGRHVPLRQQLAVRLVVAGTTDLVTAWLAGVVVAERADVVATIVAAGVAVGASD